MMDGEDARPVSPAVDIIVVGSVTSTHNSQPPAGGPMPLLSPAVGEADVPFFSIAASEFVELYVWMGAMRVRELFAAARKEAPAIVFIDEIDAVAKVRRKRGSLGCQSAGCRGLR